eukprot:scaffold133765_cov60-Attheya_sp.AAC.4
MLLSPVLSLALEYLLPPSLYHWFLKAMGGNVGKHAFWNQPQMRAGMEHIDIGANFHSGFSQVWTTQEISSEGVRFNPISIGDRCTIGQRAVIMPGVTFGSHVTVGSEGTLPPNMNVATDGTVVGNPPVVFRSTATDEKAVRQLQDAVRNDAEENGDNSDRSRVDTDSSDEEEGSAVLFNIIAIALNLSKLPSVVFVFLGMYYLFQWVIPFDTNITAGYILIAVSTFLGGIVAIATFVAVLTRVGVSSMKRGFTSYYTLRFVVWWYCTWLNRFCSGLLLYPFHGTVVYNWWLRFVGAKVGKGCFIDPGTGGFLEIDNMQIGNGTVILTNNIHGHFVDHNKLQFAPVRLGNFVRLNEGAAVMPFTTIQDGITLLSQCTTIKGQVLKKKDGGFYMGNVAFEVSSEGMIPELRDSSTKHHETEEMLHSAV